MPRIHQLPPHEAHKIAAGEVVERPANVVKELVENSLDAQATSISIYIEQAGKKLIRIVDNGHGMDPEDAQRCFDHHATSKITSVNDLTSLLTFGFRGEALSSIAAVSSVTLITKEASASEGVKIEIEGSQRTGLTSVACGTGTDISIQHIFYNVPARKKFLKSDDTEWRQIVLLFQALCLDYLSVHFSLYHDNVLIHNCPPAKDLSTRIMQVWDVSFSSNIISLSSQEKDGIHISGSISNHYYARYDRSQIFFFVNKRWVKNGALSKALLKGYLNVLPQGRFPAACIFIEVPHEEVDINIHPRKEEVQFLHPRRVEFLLQESVKKTLETHVSKQIANHHTTQFDFNASPFQTQSSSLSAPAAPHTFMQHEPISSLTNNLFPTSMHMMHSFNLPPQELPIHTQASLTSMTHIDNSTPTMQPIEFNIIGQLHKTYILLEHNDGLFMVDQHAAHERILYELFEHRFDDTAINQLLFPTVITVSSEIVTLITPHLGFLSNYGIVLEQFGDNQLILKATPIHAKDISYQELIITIAGWIQEDGSLATDALNQALDKKIRAQMACKAAVKAGDILSHAQMKQLLHDLYKIEHRFTCPHGRPTGWLLSLYDMEKKFKRKI